MNRSRHGESWDAVLVSKKVRFERLEEDGVEVVRGSTAGQKLVNKF